MLVFHELRWYLLIDDEVVWSGPGELELVIQPPRFDFMRENVGDLHGSYIHRSGPTEARMEATWYTDPRSAGVLHIHEQIHSRQVPELAVMIGIQFQNEPLAWLFRRAVVESISSAPEHYHRAFRSAPADGPPQWRQQVTIWGQDPSTVFAEASVRVAKAQAALPPAASKALPR